MRRIFNGISNIINYNINIVNKDFKNLEYKKIAPILLIGAQTQNILFWI